MKIKSFFPTILLFLAAGILVSCSRTNETSRKLLSPSKNLQITFLLNGGKPFYKVDYIKEVKEISVLEKSPLGIVRKDQTFVDGLEIKSSGTETSFTDEYKMLIGKKSEIKEAGNELVITLKNKNNSLIEIVLRAYNDGVAFKYKFPEESIEKYTILSENTGFKLPVTGNAWIMPYDKPVLWAPAYEANYENNIPVGKASPTVEGWAFPALYNVNGLWVLITEANVNYNFYGAHLEQNAENGLYKIRLPEPTDGEGIGSPNPTSTLPWESPWRTIVVGPTPAAIIETNLVYNLSEPTKNQDIAWIKPGRVSWSWWSDHDSPKDINKLKPFVDIAAEMGWEYSLVDANWDIMQVGNIAELIAYAKSKNVGLILWYNSGGPHNKITERPREIMHDPVKRKAEFKKLEAWGIKGIKVDFWQSDKQVIMELYQDLLKDAAECHILVDFHGCTLPRGWSRTYPNLMTMEAVKGAEQYSWDKYFCENANLLHSIYPYTRNTVGPMDYTPVTFTNYKDSLAHTTTFGHELALAVVFESGLQHFADAVQGYKSLPAYAKQFLKDVPAAWDETKYISGIPGKDLVIARRKAQTWYVAAINGEKTDKVIEFTIPVTGNDEYSLNIISDGTTAKSFSNKQLKYKPGDKVSIMMLSKGGFVCVLSK